MDWNRLHQQQVVCSYCSEAMTLLVDLSMLADSSEMSYVEDCQVCCQPMLVKAAIDHQGELSVEVQRDND